MFGPEVLSRDQSSLLAVSVSGAQSGSVTPLFQGSFLSIVPPDLELTRWSYHHGQYLLTSPTPLLTASCLSLVCSELLMIGPSASVRRA